jgi:hypothetical protein
MTKKQRIAMRRTAEGVYDEANARYWGGTLPRVEIRVEDNLVRTYVVGTSFRANTTSAGTEVDGETGQPKAIVLTPEVLDIRGSVLHEMAHVAVRQRHGMEIHGEHGVEYREECERISAVAGFGVVPADLDDWPWPMPADDAKQAAALHGRLRSRRTNASLQQPGSSPTDD